MARVALSSGFSSVRRFNDASRHYGLNPRALRRAASTPDGHGVGVRLGWRPPMTRTRCRASCACAPYPVWSESGIGNSRALHPTQGGRVRVGWLRRWRSPCCAGRAARPMRPSSRRCSAATSAIPVESRARVVAALAARCSARPWRDAFGEDAASSLLMAEVRAGRYDLSRALVERPGPTRARAAPSPLIGLLTERERGVSRGIRLGASNTMAATQKLSIGPGTGAHARRERVPQARLLDASRRDLGGDATGPAVGSPGDRPHWMQLDEWSPYRPAHGGRRTLR